MGDKKRKAVDNAEESNDPAWRQRLKQARREKKEKKRNSKQQKEISARELASLGGESKPKRNKEKYNNKRDQRRKAAAETTEESLDAAAADSVGDMEVDMTEMTDLKEKTEEKKHKKEKKEKSETKEHIIAPEDQPEQENETPQEKNSRFICFVGNLPYSANQESLTKHFAKNPPACVRVATKKDDPKNRCRGFAFIEFDNYDRMKTCLQLYHHSTFDDGKYPPRRINVELTAGGGGAKSDHRKAKIQAKNEKLNEERHRKAKDIKKDKNKHQKQAAPQGATGANAVGLDGADVEDDKYAGVHPSRRGRMW